MTLPILATPDPMIVQYLRGQASRINFTGGSGPAARRHINRCTTYHAPTCAWLMYTRDVGMHTSGWLKNPDYERCLHLSISFAAATPEQMVPLPFNRKMGARWAEAFFGEHCRWLWIEPPYSPQGKARGVHHYRLFCNPGWEPIKPRGEVYSTDHTPAEWKSWSDVHAEDIAMKKET